MIRPVSAHVLPCSVAAAIVSVAAVLAGHTASIGSPPVPRAAPIPAVQVRAENVAASSATTLVRPNDARLGWLGHWAISPTAATTVNGGSRLRFTFEGVSSTAHFDLTRIAVPAQLYVTVDGGPARLVLLDRPEVELATGLPRKTHTVLVDVKAVWPDGARWQRPLTTGVTLTGLDLGPGGRLSARPAAARLRLEFYGDSITEGVSVLGNGAAESGTDGTRSFAALTALGYHADAVLVGFAGQGVTAHGLGGVGSALQTFGSNFAGSRAAGPAPDAIVINYGCNDLTGSGSAFRAAYTAYLRRVRAGDPGAWIFAVAPFNGAHAADVRTAVTALRDRRIVFVPTAGWIAAGHLPDGLRPDAAGHRTAAAHLIAKIQATTGWHPSVPAP